MKKFSAVTAIISGVCLILGIIFLIAGYLCGGTYDDLEFMFLNGYFSTDFDWREDDWREEMWNGEVKTEETSFLASEIDGLDFDVSVGTLTIKENTDNPDQILVRTVTRNAVVTVTEEDGYLKIDEDASRLFTGKKQKADITVYLPKEKVYGEINIDVSVGSFESKMEELLANEASLETDTGAVYMKNLTLSGDLDLSCSVGSVKIDALKTSGNIEADCGVGEIKLGVCAAREDFNYELGCGIGEIMVGNDSYSGLSSSRDINNHSAQEIAVNCGIGTVEIHFLD